MFELHKIIRRRATLVVSALALAPALGSAQETFPDRPITMIVGWPAGGSADTTARVVAQEMSTVIGQQIIVENRAGAGSNIGSELVAKAKPDGYTIMLATGASHGYNSALYSKLNYKPIDDFSPIGMINNSAGTLLVPVDSAYKSVQDIVTAAKAQPGKLNYGSGGVGSSQHLAGAMFSKLAGIDIAHIPFRGVAPAMIDLMAGRVEYIITTGPLPFIRGGKLRAIAIAARERHPAMPDVPTFEQAGIKGFYTDNWYGLVAPAGTPKPVLEKLNAALNTSVTKPDVQNKFLEQGAFAPKPMTTDAFWAFVKQNMPVAAEAVNLSGAKAE